MLNAKLARLNDICNVKLSVRQKRAIDLCESMYGQILNLHSITYNMLVCDRQRRGTSWLSNGEYESLKKYGKEYASNLERIAVYVDDELLQNLISMQTYWRDVLDNIKVCCNERREMIYNDLYLKNSEYNVLYDKILKQFRNIVGVNC